MRTLFLSLVAVTLCGTIPTNKLPQTLPLAAASKTSASSVPPYLLRVVLPHGCHVDGLIALCNGQPVTLNEHGNLLPITTRTSVFSLVITESIDYAPEGNGIRYRKRFKNLPCLWYDVTLMYDNEVPAGYRWEISELTEDAIPLRIPEHAIVIFLEPRFVTGLKECSDTRCSEYESTIGAADEGIKNVFILPHVMIDPTIACDELQESLGIIGLGIIDVLTLHRAPHSAVERSEKHSIVAFGT